MTPYNFSLLFFAAGTFLISFFIFLKRQDKIGKSFFVFSTLVTVWASIFSIGISKNISHNYALLAFRTTNFLAMFLSLAWLRFVLIFCDAEHKYKIFRKFVFYNCIFIALFAFSKWFIVDVRPAGPFKYYSIPGLLFVPYTVLFFIIVWPGFFELIVATKKSSGKRRLSLLELIVGTAIGFIAGSLTFCPSYGIYVPQYAIFLMPLYPFIMAHALIRGSLFDPEELAQAAHRDKLAAMGTLASSMNHEVRNPLFVARGIVDTYLTDLEEGIYKDPQETVRRSKESFQKVSQQIQRASDIMKSFSSFAKQNIAENFRFERVNLKQVLDAVIPLVKYELERDEVRMEMDVSSEIHVQADTRHLEEIFFNLIVNACQAMKHTDLALDPPVKPGDDKRGGGVIKIAATQELEKVLITVADNGPGIPEEHFKNVFKPFYTTKEDGTGLGLYITKQLIDRCRGHISVESQLSRGTTFILEFKL